MKQTLLSFTLALVTLGLFAQDLSNGLLLHYDFNGNANDVSGNGMHATVYGATLTTDKDGNPNSAYYFDGVDDYIELPNDPSLKPQLPVTVAFYAKFENFFYQASLFGSDYVENSYHGVVINAHGGKIIVSYGDGDVNLTDPQSRRTKESNFILDTDVWYRIVCIVRGATDMSIYVDCVETGGTYSGTGGPLAYSSSPGVIGEYDYNTNKAPYFMKGYIDDVRYWNRALTEAEVELLCPTLSVQENKQEPPLKSIYPNPSNGEVNLVVVDNKPMNIEIYDVTGKVVNRIDNFMGKELKVKGLPEGLYFVKVYNELSESTQRIIITNH